MCSSRRAGDVRKRRRLLTFDVIIPWRAGCPYRKLNLDWIVNGLESFGHNVILGELEPDQPWSKARAVQAGLAQSTTEHVVISDGDVWSGHLEQAVDMLAHFPYSVPFHEVKRLSPQATGVALMTGDLGGKLQQQAYRGVEGGGLLAISREHYERVPLDPRFVGWGQEDESWGMALSALLGKGWRHTEPLYHLWHPPQERQNRATGSEASRNLRNQYLRARRDLPRMQALVDEARSLLHDPASV